MAKVKNKIKPIDAPIYGYWRALFMSFYSRRLYIDVGKRWHGHGILYVLLLIALWSIPFSVKLAIDLNELFQQQLIEPLSIIPTIYIQNGKASFDKPMPYYVKNKSNQVVLIIDTTGKITDFSDKYPQLSVLINDNKVAFRVPSLQLLGTQEYIRNTNAPIIQYFTAGDNAVLDGKNIVRQKSFNNWKYVAQLSIYPVVTVIFFAMFLFLFLVFGFLGQAVSRIFFSFTPTLKQSNRLLMVSATPMMGVLLCLLLSNNTFPGFGFLLIAILALYFGFAAYALKSESMRLVNL